jgi:glycosyltransferase involved in cell wall biosynthesis
VKVLLVSQFYPPEPNSAAQKLSDLARHLRARGHQATVVTGFPNYPDGVLYPGYRRALCRRETIDGVPVFRTFVTVTPKRREFGPRMGNYLSFMLSSIYGALRAGRHDLVYVYSPPLFLGVSGYVISRWFRVPFILDVHDLWPKAPIQMGIVKHPMLVRIAEGLERFLYAKADRVFFYSYWMREETVRSGLPEGKTEVHPLWVDTEVFRPVSDGAPAEIRKRHAMGEGLVVMYAGNLGLPQGLDTAIECARLLRDRRVDDVRFVFVGGGADRERLIGLARGHGLENVLFVPSQPVSSMPAFMSAADVLLLHLDKAPFRLGTIPGKLVTYMSCGRAVLAGLEGEGARLITEAGCGVVVEPQNPDAMAEGLLRLRNPDLRRAMGEAGRRTAVDRFDRQKLLAEFEDSLERVARRDHPAVATAR